jgi:hypothetical protein
VNLLAPHRATFAAVALLLLLPCVLLWPCIGGGRTLVPYDLAQFPPASVNLTPAQLQQVRAHSNYDVTEIPVMIVPELRQAHRELADEHALPQWNPTARCGNPLLAHGADGLLYPPTWLALLRRDPQQGLVWLAVVNFLLAGLLTFGLLRELGFSRPAALFGALVFAYSGTATAIAQYYMRFASLVWLPGVLWAALRIRANTGRRRLLPLAGFAAALALTWLGGFPPYSAVVTLLAVLFCAWLAVAEHRERGRLQGRALGGWFLLAGVLGFAVAAVHLLPVLLFFPESARTPSPGLAQVSQVAFDRYGFLGYLLPDLFGDPNTAAQLPYERSPLPLWFGNLTEYGGGLLRPNFNFTEYAVFPGTLALLLALLGVCVSHGRHRGFAIGGLALLFGLATFAWPLCYLFVLPGLRAVPPLRCLGPASLFVAWLAAAGCDTLLQGTARRRTLTLGCTGLFLAGLCLLAGHALAAPTALDDIPAQTAARYQHLGAPGLITPTWMREQWLQQRQPDGTVVQDYLQQGRLAALAACRGGVPWFALAGAVLLAAGMLRTHRRVRFAVAWTGIAATCVQLLLLGRTLDGGKVLDHATWTPVQDFLVQQRADAADAGGFTIARADPLPDFPSALPPGSLEAAGIRDLHAYTFFDRRSAEPLMQLFGQTAGEKGFLEKSLPDDDRLHRPLLDLLGVKYVLSTHPLQHAGPRVGPRLHGPGGEFFLYERPSALPRAFVVPSLEPVADDAAAVAALTAPDFQPRRHALATPAEAARLAALPDDPAAAARRVRFAVDHGNEVVLQISAGAPGVLVLADTWMPGWTAAVDGVPSPLARIDHSFRGVAVPGRACSVRFVYATPGLLAGAWIALGAGLVLTGLLFVGWRASSATRPTSVSRLDGGSSDSP